MHVRNRTLHGQPAPEQRLRYVSRHARWQCGFPHELRQAAVPEGQFLAVVRDRPYRSHADWGCPQGRSALKPVSDAPPHCVMTTNASSQSCNTRARPPPARFVRDSFPGVSCTPHVTPHVTRTRTRSRPAVAPPRPPPPRPLAPRVVIIVKCPIRIGCALAVPGSPFGFRPSLPVECGLSESR